MHANHTHKVKIQVLCKHEYLQKFHCDALNILQHTIKKVNNIICCYYPKSDYASECRIHSDR